MENKSYSAVIGASSAPYETQLAHQCASDTHGSHACSQYDSLPNYIALTTGQSGSILAPFTCDCAPSSSVSVTVDNIFRQGADRRRHRALLCRGDERQLLEQRHHVCPEAQSGAVHVGRRGPDGVPAGRPPHGKRHRRQLHQRR